MQYLYMYICVYATLNNECLIVRFLYPVVRYFDLTRLRGVTSMTTFTPDAHYAG